MDTAPRRSFCPFAFALASLAPLAAQCPLQLLPGDGVPGANGEVRCATHWDPDGAGPLPARLVVAGNFTLLGTTLANRIAERDPATGVWAPIGTGMNGPVQAVLGLPNGDLIAAGQFETAGGNPARWLARWSGGAWSAMHGQFHYYSLNASFGVHALAVLPPHRALERQLVGRSRQRCQRRAEWGLRDGGRRTRQRRRRRRWQLRGRRCSAVREHRALGRYCMVAARQRRRGQHGDGPQSVADAVG
jgi:hypothetical protein